MISNSCLRAYVLSYRHEVLRFWKRTLHSHCVTECFSDVFSFLENFPEYEHNWTTLVIVDCAGFSKEDEEKFLFWKSSTLVKNCFYVSSNHVCTEFVSELEKTDAVPLPFPCEFSLINEAIVWNKDSVPLHANLEEQNYVPRLLTKFSGNSNLACSVREEAFKFGNTDVPLILHGEPGTGKTFLAKLIHDCSSRCGKEFQRINMPNIQEEIAEAALFGTVSGAFTGAKESSGILQNADGGTVLFDEVSELSLKIQAKLLKFLDSGTFCKVGSTKEIKVDVRVISATNMDLEELVLSGRMRKDFFQRIKGKVICVPPLRKRTEDIPCIANTYLCENGMAHRRFSDSAVNVLKSRLWSGNIRELKHCLDLTTALTKSQVIEAHELVF